ncbi:MAG: iron ABC transporter permease [Gemmatimonadales bacterium]|jgi:iron complex transport system permease protein|nr:MAG: iron ABC transporter permease [Gemmatimonadales bacterium]
MTVRKPIALVLGVALVLLLPLGLFLGSVALTPADVLAVLLGGGSEVQREILLQFRLPRLLVGSILGGGLALAGATFQALLRNPLAEPYILGISGGAALGAVTVLALGLTTLGSWSLPLAAFAGALLAIVLVFRVATATGRALDVRVLLLAGVVVGAFFAAVISFILAVSDARTVRSAVLWMMGTLYGSAWSDVVVVAAYTLPTALLLMTLARPLNTLSVGEETALYLGTEVERVKRIAFAAASLITAAGVAVAGVIGFVGLVVPHALRLVVGSDHRILLPLSFLLGAVFLTSADMAAQVLLTPTEIPIGVVTALVGVPIFLVLLRRSAFR